MSITLFEKLGNYCWHISSHVFLSIQMEVPCWLCACTSILLDKIFTASKSTMALKRTLRVFAFYLGVQIPKMDFTLIPISFL